LRTVAREIGKRRKTKDLRETKRGRVAETARETIKTAEGRTGRRFDADADVPTLLFYPISGGVKGGPGAFFERRRAKKRRRSVGGARVWPDVWRSGVGGRVDRRLKGKRRFSDVGGERFRRDRARARRFSPLFSLLPLLFAPWGERVPI